MEIEKLSMEEHRLDDQIRFHGYYIIRALHVAIFHPLDGADSH